MNMTHFAAAVFGSWFLFSIGMEVTRIGWKQTISNLGIVVYEDVLLRLGWPIVIAAVATLVMVFVMFVTDKDIRDRCKGKDKQK